MPEVRLESRREFGHYVLLEPLGKGGIGEVWKAMDKRLGRVVALKFISQVREGSTAAGELFREARAASVLNHPNIVTVLDIGDSDLGCYMSMEFVDGESLRARLSKGPVELEEALRIFRQAAEGLAMAHRKGIVHRDLKPENIMLRADGYVKLVDFGLAKVLPWAAGESGSSEAPTVESSKVAQTETGTLVGTFRYMSPEQARGLHLTPASDVFSLGIVMHEALTGQNPFQAPTTMDTLQAILSREPESIEKKCPEAPPEVTSTISKALQKDPSQRFASAVEMASALGEISTSVAKIRAPKVIHQPKWKKVVGGVMVVLLMSVGAWVAVSERSTGTSGAAGLALRQSGSIQSVAAVPLRATIVDEQLQLLAKALPEDINMVLGKAGIRVASTSRALATPEGEDPQATGQRLGVDAVLTGSLRSYGGKVKLRFELVSTTTGFQLWNETYTLDAAEAIASEERIAAEVGAKIRIAIADGR
jgi:TolB-like protein